MSATVSAGRRPGYSEVSFASKPGDDVRAALKVAGFRWAPSTSVWYGLTSRLPAVVAPSGAPVADSAPSAPPVAPADALSALAAQLAALQAQIAALTTAAPAPAPAAAPARPAAPVARRASAPKASAKSSARMIGAAPDAGVWS